MKRIVCSTLAAAMVLMLPGCSADAQQSAQDGVGASPEPAVSSVAPVDSLVDQNIGDVYYSVPQTWRVSATYDDESITYYSLDDNAKADSAFVMVTITDDPDVSEDNAKQRVDDLAKAVKNSDWARNCELVKSTIDDRYYAKLTLVNTQRDEVSDTLLYIFPVYGAGKLMITASAKTGADRDLQADCDTIIDSLEIWD